jgi:uncharacterized protein (TIGR02145 family)
MKKSIVISLSTLFACTISFAASPVGREHFYGEWTSGDTLTFIYNISANSYKLEIAEYTSLGIPFKVNLTPLKWEYVNNLDKTLNINFPNGYLVKTKRGDGNPTYFYLWRHHKRNDIIMCQTEDFFLEGKYEILNKSVPFKQTDFYGEWKFTDGVSVDNVSTVNISAKNIKYSSFENRKSIEFNLSILRWESVKNQDEASVANFPDGYIVSTESVGGHPKTIYLWRKSKSNDMILYHQLDGESIFLVRAKSLTGVNDVKKYKTVAEHIEFLDQTLQESNNKDLTDARDGKKYKIVTIGTQTWMAENLNYNANGSKCYDNKTANCQKYGRLYNWETARLVCPKGWHLPGEEEWDALIQYVNPSCSLIGTCYNGGKLLKATSGWNRNGNGTDAYGFTALPGGFGSSDGSISIQAGDYGYWWVDSEDKNIRMIGGDPDYTTWKNGKSLLLYSVRCVRD